MPLLTFVLTAYSRYSYKRTAGAGTGGRLEVRSRLPGSLFSFLSQKKVSGLIWRRLSRSIAGEKRIFMQDLYLERCRDNMIIENMRVFVHFLVKASYFNFHHNFKKKGFSKLLHLYVGTGTKATVILKYQGFGKLCRKH